MEKKPKQSAVQIPAEVVAMIVNAVVEMKKDELAFRREILAVEKESLAVLRDFTGSAKSLLNLFEKKVSTQLDIQNEGAQLHLEQGRWEFEQKKASVGERDDARRDKLRV
jgi:hypothetical protein